MTQRITSRANPLLRRIGDLCGSAAAREADGYYVCEGEKLLAEALRSGAEVETAVWDESAFPGEGKYGVPRQVTVPKELYSRISTLKNAHTCLFTVRLPGDVPPVPKRGQVMVLDGVQDPGNVGTVIRSADAFGAEAVWMIGACADVYSPRTARATMGSLFRVPVVRSSPETLLEWLRRYDIPLYAAALADNACPVEDVSLARAAVAVGSEGKGVSAWTLGHCTRPVILPMPGPTESLNAAVAASILLWEMSKCH